MAVNDLREAVYQLLVGDAALTELLGGTDRVLAAWPARDVALTSAKPAYVILTWRATGSPARPVFDKQASDLALTVDVIAKSERLAWRAVDRVRALLQGRRIETDTLVAAFARAGGVIATMDASAHRLTMEIEIAEVFELT